MPGLMRCPYCGLLQDEPSGVKACARCGGGLEFDVQLTLSQSTYLNIDLELDQVAAPAGQNVERYILATLRTPKQVPPEEAAPPGVQRLPLSFTAVLDVSGSMQGEKIMQAKTAVRQATRHLHDGDALSLVIFSNDVHTVLKPLRIDSEIRAKIDLALDEIQAGGMTALDAGLETGIKNASQYLKDTSLVLLLSDGQANVGETDLEKVGQRAFKARKAGLLVSTLGVGLDYNEALMAEIATQGGGRFYHVENTGQIPAFVAGELGEAEFLAARNVQLRLKVPTGVTVIPLSAAYPVQQANGQAIVSLGDIPCDTEMEIPMRLAILAQPAGSRLSIEGSLSFRSPVGHELEHPVNRVTVRFVEHAAFQLREGVVLPVAERVLAKMKASSVLGVARVSALRPADAEQQSQTILQELYSYAERLGEERAEKETRKLREQLDKMRYSPAAAKASVFAAQQIVRPSKDFNK